MLKHISWTEFLVVIFSLTGLYYVVLSLLFYRKHIFRLIRRPRRHGEASEDLPASEPANPSVPQIDDFATTKEASDKIRSIIDRATNDGVDRHDLLEAISVHLKPYERLKGTAFGVAIKNSISRELENVGHTLSDQELDAVWSSK